MQEEYVFSKNLAKNNHYQKVYFLIVDTLFKNISHCVLKNNTLMGKISNFVIFNCRNWFKKCIHTIIKKYTF